MSNPLIPLINDLQIESHMLWVALIIFAVFYIGISAVLFFHWRKYGMKNSSIVFAELIFTLVSIFLFFLAGVGIAIY